MLTPLKIFEHFLQRRLQGLRFGIASVAEITVKAQIVQMGDPHIMARSDRCVRIGLGKFLGQRDLRRMAVEDKYSFRVHDFQNSSID